LKFLTYYAIRLTKEQLYPAYGVLSHFIGRRF